MAGTAVAAYHYLSPAAAASEVEDNALEKAFLGENAVLVNETQESGGYRITLLGSVAGKNISDHLTEDAAGNVVSDRIYTVVAIERADGSPMPDTSSDDYGKESFYASHYIRGLNPNTYSLMSMGGGYTEFVRDGIQYRLLEMDNLEMFADRGIYVGVSEGIFYDGNAYVYDDSTGIMSRNEDYDGVNALFELPVDKTKADLAAAEEYLKAFGDAMNAPAEPMEKDPIDLRVEEFMGKLTPENIDQYAEPIASTRQTCKVDGNGLVSFSFELESGEEVSGDMDLDEMFPDGKVGMCRNFFPYYSKNDSEELLIPENGLKDLLIQTFTLNEDGTVTFVVYQPKG